MRLTVNQLRLLALASEERDAERLIILVDEALAEFDSEVELPELHQVMDVLRERSAA